MQLEDGTFAFGHYEEDEQSGEQYFVPGGDSFGKALFKAEMANALEYYTEMLGGHISGKVINGHLAKGAEKAGLSNMSQWFTRRAAASEAFSTSGTNKFLNSLGINGYFGEVAEEEANIVLNSLLVGDNKFSDLWDGKTQADIWGGMLFSVGAMEGIGYGAEKGFGAVSYHKARKRVDDAELIARNRLASEIWEPLQERIDNTPNEEIKDIVDEIANDGDLQEQEKRAVLEYVGALTRFRGFNQGSIVEANSRVETSEEGEPEVTDRQRITDSLNASYSQGGSAFDLENEGDVVRRYNLAENNLRSILGDETDYSELDIDGLAEVALEMQSEDRPEQEIQAFLEYANARMAHEGMLDYVEGQVEIYDRTNREIAERVKYAADGGQVFIQLDNGESAFVTQGNIVLLEDGTVDKAASDKTLTVYCCGTNKIDMIPPDRISEVLWQKSADEVESGLQYDTEQYRQSMEDRINGVISQEEGSKILMPDNEGNPTEGTIVGNNGDQIQVVLASGDVVTIGVAEAQAYADKIGDDMFETEYAKHLEDQSEEQSRYIDNTIEEDDLSETEEDPGEGIAENGTPAEEEPFDLEQEAEIVFVDEDGKEQRGYLTGYRDPETGKVEYYKAGEKKMRYATDDELREMIKEIKTIEKPVAAEGEPGEIIAGNGTQGTEAPVGDESAIQPPNESKDEVEAAPETPAVPEQPAEAVAEAMPTDKDGEPQFMQVTPERGYAYIFKESGLDPANAETFVDNNLKEATKTLDKLKESEPKIGTSIAKHKQQMEAWGQKVSDAERAVEYWRKVAEMSGAEAPRNNRGEQDAGGHGADLRQETEQTARGVESSLSEEEANVITAKMKSLAEPARDIALTPESWEQEFGADGVVETPLGKVKMGEHQYLKLLKNKRENYFGMIKPTLERPDIVLEEHDPKEGAERDSKLLYVKTFIKPDGSRYVHFESVTVQRDNMEVSISSHEIQPDAMNKKMQHDKVLHLDNRFLSSEGRLTEPQGEGSDLVPTPNHDSSEGKVSDFASEKQISEEESLMPDGGSGTETPRTEGPTQPTEPAGKTTEPAEQQGGTPLQRIPRDEKGEPMFEQADPELAWDALVEFSEGNVDTAREIADGMVAEKKKAFAKAKKLKSSGKNPAEMLASRKKITAEQEKAQQEYDKWQQIAGVEAARKKAEEEMLRKREQERKEEEEARKRELESFMPDDTSIEDCMDGYELAAKVLSNLRLLPEDYRKHTGHSLGEQRSLVGLVAKAGNGGIGVERAAERLVEEDNAFFQGAFFQGDTSAALDAIIDVLQEGNPRGYIKRHREAMQKELDAHYEAAEDRWYYEQYGMDADAYKAYEDHEYAEMVKHYRDFDEAEYNGWIADEEAARQAYEDLVHEVMDMEAAGMPDADTWNRHIVDSEESVNFAEENKTENGKEEHDTTGEEPADGGSGEILPDTQVDESGRGTEGSAWEPGGEAGDGRKGDNPDGSLSAASQWGSGTEVEAPRNNRGEQDAGGHGPEYSVGGSIDATPEQRAIGEALADIMRDAGIEVVEDTAEMERALGDEAMPTQRREYIYEVSKKFDDELQQQIDGTLPQGHIYQLGTPGSILLSTGVPNLPIELSAQKLIEKATKFDHDFNLSEIKGLVDELQRPVAVFAYGDKSKAQNIIVEITHNGKNFVVGMSLAPTVEGQKLEINSIRNVFPKDNAEWVKWIQDGKLLYVNKNKIQPIINQLQTNPADVAKIKLDLKGVANLIKKFENPKITMPIVEKMKTGAGEVYGFVKDGKIYLDPQLMNANTPVHEYTHLWDKALQKGNPELWSRGKELLKQTPLWDEVVNDPAYADIAHDEDLVASEVHSRLSGEKGQEYLDRMDDARRNNRREQEAGGHRTLKERIKAWLGDALAWVRDAFSGKWGREDLAKLTVEEFSAMPIRDLASGVNPAVEERRASQAERVKETNPMFDDYHYGIRNMQDVKTFEEVLADAEQEYSSDGELAYPDLSIEDLRKAQKEGTIEVYSSKPIEDGNFVSTSRRMAEDYAGGGKVYSKRVNLTDVAWLDHEQGQMAKERKPEKVMPIQMQILGENGARNLDAADHADESARTGNYSTLEASERMRNLEVAREMESKYKEIEGSEEHQRMVQAAKEVRELEPVEVAQVPSGKEEARKIYNEIGLVTNKATGAEVKFYKSAFKKNHKDRGLFEKAIPALKESFEKSVLAYSENDRLGGTERKDGTVHKEHPDIDSYDNYVGKVLIEGNDYYVRYTVTRHKGNDSGTHSMFVTDVELYENAAARKNDTEFPSGRTSDNGVVDTKLQQFFVLASFDAKENAQRIKFTTGWERGADGKWRYEVPDVKLSSAVIEAQKRRSDKAVELYREMRNTKNREEQDRIGKEIDNLHNEPYTLGELFGDEEIIKAYPELSDVKVRFDERWAPSYDHEEQTIHMRRQDGYGSSLRNGYGDGDFIHELQHAIQYIEGFAQGTNPIDAKGYDRYLKAMGEVESRNAKRRMDYSEEERRNSLLASTEDVAREDQIFLRDNTGASLSTDLIGHADESARTGNYLPIGAMDETTEDRLEEMNKRLEEIALEEETTDSVEPLTETLNELQSMWEELTNEFGENPENEEVSNTLTMIENAMRRWRWKDVTAIPEEGGNLENPEERGNFVQRYTTKNGTTIKFESSNPEVYNDEGLWSNGNLFGFEEEGEDVSHGTGRKSGAAGRQGTLPVQRENRKLTATRRGDLNREEGEFCNVERIFRESGAFEFTAGEKITGPEDVAFIFEQLEDASVENAFAVFVKRGKPTVLHVGTGSFAKTTVNTAAIKEAYTRLKPDRVYFVHNHPSGKLLRSPEDLDTLNTIEKSLGTEVTGIIMNLKSGKFGMFDNYVQSELDKQEAPENQTRLRVYSFDRYAFSKDFDPSKITTPYLAPADIASYISSQRLGNRNKISMLVFNRAMGIIGNIHTPYTRIDSSNLDELAEKITSDAIVFGGDSVILYGDYKTERSEILQNLKEAVRGKSGKAIRLNDCIKVYGNNSWESAYNQGLMSEPEVEYGDRALGEAIAENGMLATAERMSEGLHTPVTIFETEEELKKSRQYQEADGATREKMLQARGWFDNRTGEVVLNIPQNRDAEDVAATMLHEIVAHRGLWELAGGTEEGEQAFYDEIYDHLRSKERERVNEKMNSAGYDRAKATKEYMGDLSEKGFEDFDETDRGIWEKLKAKVLEWIDRMLAKAGVKLPKWVRLGDNELRYMLWKSKKNLENPAAKPQGTVNDYVRMAEEVAKRRELGLGDISFRDAGETGDIWRDESMGLQERVTNAAVRLSNNNAEDLTLKNEAVSAIGGNLADLRKAMSAQRKYDITTVKRVSDLSRIMLENGYLSGLNGNEIRSLLSAIKSSVGKQDITHEVERVMDVMVNVQLRNGKHTLMEMLSIQGSKVNAQGVEVQGKLDPAGQHTLRAMKKSMGFSEDEIIGWIGEAMYRMSNADKTISEEATLEYAGLNLALEYVQRIKGSEADEKNLRQELKEAEESKQSGQMDAEGYRQFKRSTEDAIRQNKIERAEAYYEIVARVSGALRESIENASHWREAEKVKLFIKFLQRLHRSDFHAQLLAYPFVGVFNLFKVFFLILLAVGIDFSDIATGKMECILVVGLIDTHPFFLGVVEDFQRRKLFMDKVEDLS